MLDYLKSQRLWRMANNQVPCPVEATPGTPMAAEAAFQAAWDKNLEQIQGIIGSRISTTLHPHLGTTCAETWANLHRRFSTPGVSEIVADMYAAYSMKLSATHNPHPDIERMNMLFERLWANSMDLSDTMRGIILLNAIPREWSMVTQIYSQANWTLATTTFIGVRDAIMVEFE